MLSKVGMNHRKKLRMKRLLILMAVVCVMAAGIMAAGTLRAADGDERFLGGWFDGYDMSSFDQAGTNTIASVAARFKGGSYDGYDSDFKTGTCINDGLARGGVLRTY